MTNEQAVKALPRKEFAAMLIKESREPEYDEGIDGEMHECGLYSTYIAPDGESFWEDYDGALQHTCWWLAQGHKK